ncbi:MAG: ABC transporter permease [Chloroflexi bacterium]|nr:ABC transporter permease [Chloroflexota bacterium]
MTRYISKRLLAMLPVLFLVSFVVFMLLHLTPGDPALIMLGEEATPQNLAALRHELGLDQPLPLQFLSWMEHIVRGDLGRSIRTHQQVLEAIVERLPVTIELTALAMIISLFIALPTGIISATRRNSFLDLFSTTGALLGISMPNFFLAILLIFIFAVTLRWLPPIGYTPIQKDLLENIRGMILPAITLGAAASAIVARLTRSSLLEVLSQDYVRTAQAKGLAERTIIYTHALKNAMIPVVTIIGLQIGALIGGAVITETIFVLPGVGSLVVDSIFRRDYPLVQGAVLFISIAHLFVNLVVDILYAFLDPRIRYA